MQKNIFEEIEDFEKEYSRLKNYNSDDEKTKEDLKNERIMILEKILVRQNFILDNIKKHIQ